jgi:hypothetical protein
MAISTPNYELLLNSFGSWGHPTSTITTSLKYPLLVDPDMKHCLLLDFCKNKMNSVLPKSMSTWNIGMWSSVEIGSLCVINEIKSKSFWSRMGPKPNEWCPYKNRGRHTEILTKKRSCNVGGRVKVTQWLAKQHLGFLEATRSQEEVKKYSYPEPSEGT